MLQPIQIWALGSVHGDDAVGWWIGRRLSEKAHCARYVHLARSAWDLLDEPSDHGWLIIIDAVCSSAPPGTIHRIDRMELLPMVPRDRSSHAASIREVLQLAANLGHPWDRFIAFGVEVEACEVGAEMSDLAREAAEQVVSEVSDLVRRWQSELLEG